MEIIDLATNQEELFNRTGIAVNRHSATNEFVIYLCKFSDVNLFSKGAAIWDHASNGVFRLANYVDQTGSRIPFSETFQIYARLQGLEKDAKFTDGRTLWEENSDLSEKTQLELREVWDKILKKAICDPQP